MFLSRIISPSYAVSGNDEVFHSKLFYEDFLNDDLHRAEFGARVDLEAYLPGIGGVVADVGDLAAVEPDLKMVGLGADLHSIPAVAVDEGLVGVHCDEHLTGAIDCA